MGSTPVKSPSASFPTSWEGTATKRRDPTHAASMRELGGFLHQGPAPPRDDFARTELDAEASSGGRDPMRFFVIIFDRSRDDKSPIFACSSLCTCESESCVIRALLRVVRERVE